MNTRSGFDGRRQSRRVTWVVTAASNPMGQQRYEAEIQSALLKQVDQEQWAFRRLALRSLRSSLVGDRRYPAGFVSSAPMWATLSVGAILYRGSGLVHRFDLRLPPAYGPEVLTVLDLAPLRFHDEGQIRRSAAASARRARMVICPSVFAASEVDDLLGVQCTAVIPCGLGASYDHPEPLPAPDLQRLGLGSTYVLHAGGASDRKNLPALARAWQSLAPRLPGLSLALCGPPDERRTRLFQGLPHVQLLGRLETSVVAQLTAGAAALIVPSLYEGFGLPALEGMACGVPVVAARAGALPEVCGGAAELVEPDADGLAAGLERVLTDSLLAQRLRKEGPVRAAEFSWEKAAREHLRVYDEALAG